MQLIRYSAGVSPAIRTVLIHRDNDGRVVKVFRPSWGGKPPVDITDTLDGLHLDAIQAKVDADVARLAAVRAKQAEAIAAAATRRRDDYDPELTADGRVRYRYSGD